MLPAAAAKYAHAFVILVRPTDTNIAIPTFGTEGAAGNESIEPKEQTLCGRELSYTRKAPGLNAHDARIGEALMMHYRAY